MTNERCLCVLKISNNELGKRNASKLSYYTFRHYLFLFVYIYRIHQNKKTESLNEANLVVFNQCQPRKNVGKKF